MVPDENSSAGYILMRKAGRYKSERHNLSDVEIKSILDQLNRPPITSVFGFNSNCELTKNDKVLKNIKSKNKWMHILNDVYRKISPDKYFRFARELDKDGNPVLDNMGTEKLTSKIEMNAEPLKTDPENDKMLDMNSSRWIPIEDQEKSDIMKILSAAGSKKKKVNGEFGYDKAHKCFTLDERPIIDKKEFQSLVDRLNGGVVQSDHDRWNHFVFTKEGSKIGAHVGSFSLPPLHSCMDDVPCAKQGCYALKSYGLYPLVAAGWDNNLALLEGDGKYEQFIQEAIQFIESKKLTHFRFQVSGDVFSKEYRDAIFEVAKHFGSKVKFWLYTKNYEVFRGASKPDNLVVILSAWGKFQPDDEMLKDFPVAFLYDESDPNITRYVPQVEKKDGDGGLKICPCTMKNNATRITCESCEICFTRKAYNNLAFNKH